MARSPHSLAGGQVLMWSSPLLLLVLLFTVTAHSSTSTPSTTSTRPAATTSVTPSTTTTPVTTTSSPRSTPATASSARSSASAGGAIESAGAPSGVLSGELGPGLAGVAVPLSGPGRWALQAGTGIGATLSCPSGSGAVVGDATIAVRETCELVLSTDDPARTTTWRLTPVG